MVRDDEDLIFILKFPFLLGQWDNLSKKNNHTNRTFGTTPHELFHTIEGL